MRIRKLSIHNFRGVEECEVAFSPTGLTVIEGPNEVGKSSLAEAVDLLLEYPHDSRHHRLDQVRPLHRSGGPEVEMEFTTGPYHLIYGKRWFNRPETRLTIVAPTPESLVARGAHDRVRAILKETLDETLYRALRFVQGEKIQQGSVGTSTTLIGALDRAASGGEADAKAESTLWDAVQKERLRYFTGTGRVSQEREQLAGRVAEADSRFKAAMALLEEMEGVGESLRAASQRLQELRQDASEAEAQSKSARSEHDQMAKLEARVQTKKAEVTTAELQEQAATDAKRSRDVSAAAVEELKGKVQELTDASSQERPELSRLADEALKARSELENAEGAHRVAAGTMAVTEADLNFRRSELDHRLLSNRLKRVQTARGLETSAHQLIEDVKVTPKARSLAETAVNELMRARAAREVASPTLTATARQGLDIELDGQRIHLEKGAQHKVAVEDETVLGIDDLIAVQVLPGRSGEDLNQALADAEQGLAKLRQRFGLTSSDPLAEVSAALEALRDAQRDVADAEKSKRAALEDLTEEQLAAKVQSTGQLANTYLQQRSSDLPVPRGLDEAEVAYDEAKRRAAAEHSSVDNCRAAERELQQGLRDAQITASTHAEQLRMEMERLEKAQSELQEARTVRGDSELEVAATDASKQAQEAGTALLQLESEFSALDPEGVQLRFDNSEKLVQRIAAEQSAESQRKTQLETTLQVKGASDLDRWVSRRSGRREAD